MKSKPNLNGVRSENKWCRSASTGESHQKVSNNIFCHLILNCLGRIWVTPNSLSSAKHDSQCFLSLSRIMGTEVLGVIFCKCAVICQWFYNIDRNVLQRSFSFFSIWMNWPFERVHRMLKSRAMEEEDILTSSFSLSPGASSWRSILQTDRQGCSAPLPWSFSRSGSGWARVITLQGRRCSSATDSILDCCQLYGKIWPISLFSVSLSPSVTDGKSCLAVKTWWELLCWDGCKNRLNSNNNDNKKEQFHTAFKGKVWHFCKAEATASRWLM